MAIINWEVKTENLLTNTTKLKDADNKIQASIDSLAEWVNSTGEYTTNGLKTEVQQFLSDNANFFSDNQTIFDNKIIDYDAQVAAKKVEWDTELQSIVDDSVVTEW